MSFIITRGLESNTVHPYPSKLITQGYGSAPSTGGTASGGKRTRYIVDPEKEALLSYSLMLNAVLSMKMLKEKEKK